MQYHDLKEEFEKLLKLIRSEKKSFHSLFDKKKKEFEKNKAIIDKLSMERQIGFPWLAEAYDEYFKIDESEVVEYLQRKKHPAYKAADLVKEYSQARRKAEKEKKIAEYLVKYYESVAPFLIDLKEEVTIPTEEDVKRLSEYTDEEREDGVTNYLTKDEYRGLSSVERNQMALDRFWKRPKSNWLIGRLYERYVGYLYEIDGYDVEYVGIFKGFEDLGRDLICRKGREIVVIQCKNWAKFRTIYEKHIFQFFGTVFQFKDENPGKKIKGVFYATTKLSDLAKRFSEELGIGLEEEHVFDRDYPCIKCNISKRTGEKIYHLPFDQQYDKVKIEPENGEFYCKTVKEAEKAKFRRAFRYSGLKGKSK
ncbi:hypothetical protein HOG17_04785 [Candidatus Peregrinibacteria bacterium]|mgnify:CR=1 FL=1|jgi:hypothetical protein|nr:hypothetical protein [Candidatus Peregrinibacteria bacterium]MBT4147881.1 hypothetical protein [Candidatus Peregrinibacteria bacterium]MBT4455845.1 hypothetical protein [Candidatus Peregrinibacteria bacterium]